MIFSIAVATITDDHLVVRYKFGIDADPTIVPEYGDAYPGEENNYW